MITYVDVNNSLQYQEFFKKINDISTLNIQSIEEYYQNIEAIKDLANGIYTRLPLTEPFFYIDANSRKIDVPEDFKRNGIGVVGDQVAEILYFKVARYFDRTDLGREDITILFEWNLSSDPKNPDPYILPNYLKDIESEPGYIIFGCPINDRITETSGTKEVSVKFIKGSIEAGVVKNIEYSLNTIPTRVAVNDGLKLLMSTFIDSSVNELINNRFQNSEASSAQVKEPVILLTNVINGTEFLVDLQPDSNGAPMLYVSAISPDAGKLEYSLYKNREKILTILEDDLNNIDFIVTNDSVKDTRKKYYIKNENNEFVITTEPDFNNKEEVPLYEKIYKFGFGEIAAGEYKIQVVNKVGYDSDGEDGIVDKTYQRSAYTDVIKIPEPANPEVQPSAASQISEVYETNEDGEFVSMILEPIYTVPNGQLEKGAYLSYEWFDGESAIENSNSPILTINGNNEESNSTTVEGKHNYKVAVYNNLHGARTEEAITSGSYIVSYLPSQFITAEISGNIVQGGQAEFTYSLINSLRSDEIVCQWYIDNTLMNNSNENSKLFNIPSTGEYAGSSLKCVAINKYNSAEMACAEDLIPVAIIGKKQ